MQNLIVFVKCVTQPPHTHHATALVHPLTTQPPHNSSRAPTHPTPHSHQHTATTQQLSRTHSPTVRNLVLRAVVCVPVLLMRAVELFLRSAHSPHITHNSASHLPTCQPPQYWNIFRMVPRTFEAVEAINQSSSPNCSDCIEIHHTV